MKDRKPEEPWSAADCPLATLVTEEEVGLVRQKTTQTLTPGGGWPVNAQLLVSDWFCFGLRQLSSFPLTSPVPSLFKPAGVDTCRGFYASFFSRCLCSLQFLPKMPMLGLS